MILPKALRQSLAILVSLALLRPDLAVASGLEARAMAVRPGAGLGSVFGVTPVGVLNFKMNAAPAMALPSFIPNPAAPVQLAATGGSLAAASAVPAAAVARHPIYEAISQLQAKGVALPETLAGPADAAKMIAAAEALPEGRMRDQMMTMAKAVSLANGPSGPPGAALGAAYDHSAAAAQPVAVTSVWTSLSRKSWMPLGLARRFAARGERLKPQAPITDMSTLEVPIGKMRWTPPAESLPASTRDIKISDKQIVGQDRALKSIYWGLKIAGPQYNLYVSGPDGSGRETAVRHIVTGLARTMPVPNDIVAVTNFDNPEEPLILEIPPGAGDKLEAAVETFVKTYQQALPAELTSKSVVAQKQKIKADFDAAVELRQEALDAEVAKVRLSGDKFGIRILMQDSEKGTAINVVPTYQKAPGEFATVGSVEELQALLAAKTFTEEEWAKAVKDGKTAAAPFLEKLEAMMDENREAAGQANAAIAKIHSTAAVRVVNRLAPIIANSVMRTRHDSPEHKEFAQRVSQRQRAFDAEVAKVRVGPYGVMVAFSQGELMVGLTKLEGAKWVPMSEAEFGEKMASGEIKDAEIKAALVPVIEKLNAMAQKNEEEHKALHAKDAPASPQEARALGYVKVLLQHAANNFPIFLPQDESDESPQAAIRRAKLDPDEMYRVSVLTSNGATEGAPVIWEKSPSYDRLFGSADDNTKGMLVQGIGPVKVQGPGGPILKSGSFLRANGGFLILNVMDVLREPGVWPALMQALRNGQAEIADGGILGLMTHKGNKYDVPAKVKVVLIGSPTIKAMLAHYEEDFARSFNAVAEFEPRLSINPENIGGYLQFMKKVITTSGGQLLDMTRDGIAAVLEFSARVAGGNTVLSSQFGLMDGLMREASYWARENGRKEIRREDVDAALTARSAPDDVYTRHMMELYQSGVFKVEASGAKVGQINGLAVMGAFGVPMRVTVVTGAGKPGIISVDRNAGSTGSSFNKALGVVEGYLKNLFGQTNPVSASISISFEQNYGGIDGDSATSTEIYAILSSLSGVPIQQRFAVTGSADQFGRVQAIGGANEKTEGFFTVSQTINKAFQDGINAVIVPADNENDLMLRPDVIQAVREGKFMIYKVSNIRQGMERLTGVPFDEILRRAQARLDELREAAKKAK